MIFASHGMRACAAVLMVGLLAAVLLPSDTSPTEAAPGRYNVFLTFVTNCATPLCKAASASATPTHVPPTATRVPPTATPNPSPQVRIEGLAEGRTVGGILRIRAVVSGSNIAKVVFQLRGPKSYDHSELVAPYYFLGDTDGTPVGWDTTGYLNGKYSLKAIATDSAGRTGSHLVNFRIGNVFVSVDRTAQLMVSQLSLGATHSQVSLNVGRANPSAVARAKDLLRKTTRFQAQHLMGWGADNPNPSPGVYNWHSLDSRITMIRSTGAEPVLTVCCAPDWMKGGQAGETNWDQIEVAPLEQYYDEYANLAKLAAARYPNVKYFQVWNEMKGFWDESANNWDYVAYTRMYNQIYDAIKSVRPDAKIGGPYLVIEGTGSNKGDWSTELPIRSRQMELIDYWLRNKRGADFICVDRGVVTKQDTNSYTVDERMDLLHTFGLVVRQLRARTNLPIWWAEYYAYTSDDKITAAMQASALRHMMVNGASVAFLWNPMDTGEVGHSLFTDVRHRDGGKPLPNAHVYQTLNQKFPPGTALYKASSSSPHVEVLASQTTTLLINKRALGVTVVLAGRQIALPGYEVVAVEG